MYEHSIPSENHFFYLKIIEAVIGLTTFYKMKIFNRQYFTTIKQQIEQLNSSYSNIPQNIHNLLDKKLLKIRNHPLSIIKEKIKSSLTDKYTVKMDKNRVRRISVR